ncbi:MAG: hypothetical protein KDJ31_16910 [Candidatus Competibacteraceae bacterium]|nr:hypothetical protein [Candidatus Competibacteraceae bacterium]MCP5451309.1 hypothetical protein [Gammaproteobacteria bacterium]
MAKEKGRPADPDLARLNAYFNDLPASPRRTGTLRNLIDGLRDTLLRAVRERGYSVRELADHLRAQGIAITPSTLRQYLGHTRTPSRPGSLHQEPVQGNRSRPLAGPSHPIRAGEEACSPADQPPPVTASRADGFPSTAPSRRGTPRTGSGSFIPKEELPLDEWLRQAQARNAEIDRATMEPAIPPTEQES